MSFDISAILNEWDYQPGQVVVRKFRGKDGVEKIQLRVDLGLLQMNAQGRPDGKRPFGRESLLDYFMAQVGKFEATKEDEDDEFRLTPEDCSKLQQEAIQYHHRYICLYQLEEYDAVIRDAERNLEACEFVDRFAPSPELSWSLQQFRPQTLMMLTRAKGAIVLNDGEFEQAVQIAEDGVEAIREFYREHERPDLLEQSAEIQSLQAWLEEIQTKRPLSPREKLENALDEAVRNEDYEKAAKVRDALKKMKT